MAGMDNLRAAPAAPTGYLPIEEHGIVGDLRTVALVGTDGTVDWYCPARFDAPSLFGALLDARKGGYFSLWCRGSGRPTFELACHPAFDYGRAPHTVQLVTGVGAVFESAMGRCVLRTDVALK